MDYKIALARDAEEDLDRFLLEMSKENVKVDNQPHNQYNICIWLIINTSEAVE